MRATPDRNRRNRYRVGSLLVVRLDGRPGPCEEQHRLGRSVGQDGGQIPAARRSQRETQYGAARIALVGEPSSALITDVAARDRQTNLGDVSGDQLWLGLDANTAERRDGLEHHENAAGSSSEVLELDVALCDHDLNIVISEPDR